MLLRQHLKPVYARIRRSAEGSAARWRRQAERISNHASIEGD
jgi:hypothetical protein